MSRHEDWPRRPWVPPVLVVLCGAIVTARVVLWATEPEGASALGPSWLWWALLAIGLIGVIPSSWKYVTGARPPVTHGTDGKGDPNRREWIGSGEASGVRGAGAAVQRVLLVAIALSAGMAIATTSLERQVATHRELASRSVSSLAFRVDRDATPTETGWWTSGDVLGGGRVLGKVWISTSAQCLAGDVLRGVGRYEANDEGEFGVSSRLRGICGTVTFVTEPETIDPTGPSGWVRSVRRALVEAIDPTADEGRALIAGAALGAREGLKTFKLDDAFSKAGLSHLMAVSGLHVALVTALLSAILFKTRCPRRVRIGSLALWGGVYVVLCGAPASAMRSFAMAGASQGADLVGRRAHGLGAVGIVGLAMALVDVSCVGDLGFLLSIACVASLDLLSRWSVHLVGVVWPDVETRRLSRDVRRRIVSLQRSARGTLAASIVCLVASFPLVAASFDSVSLLSPLANLLVAPFFEGFLVIALLASLLSWVPLLGPLAVALAAWPARGLVAIVGWFGGLPWGQARVPVEEPWATLAVPVTVALLYLLWPRPERRHLLVALGAVAVWAFAWCLVRPFLVPPRVVVLDVGQGDAILVQDGAHSLLVDTGPDDSVADALARQGVLALDAVVFTHEHADHAGGFASLQGSVTVGALYVPEGQAGALATGVDEAVASLGCPVVEVGRGDRIVVGRFRLTVLWPEGPEDGDENDECLVARLDYASGGDRLRALLTGDAESDVLDELVRRDEVGDLDLLKVGHHGSEVSVDAGALEACEPEVAVASAGEGNSYGHPDPVCVETCEGAGAVFLCTKDVGDVEVRPGVDGPVVSTQRRAALS